mmetsp:Transcript_12019/g.18444  ORF Transcript_12019/g.18444 Transcript_12019/m.18444 type:complete len:254 (+) Transcript_12019:52-813(+)
MSSKGQQTAIKDSAPPVEKEEVEEEIKDDANEDEDQDQDERDGMEGLHEAERFIAFTDAVIAIAMTLLILPLMEATKDFFVGEDGGEDKEKTVAGYFDENLRELIGFIVSFYTVALFWVQHAMMCYRIEKFTSLMLVLNFIWMLGIVFLPIGASLLALAPDDNNVKYGVYMGSMILSRVAGLGMSIITRIDKRTWKNNKNPGNTFIILDALMILLLVIALLVSLFTNAGLSSLLILGAGPWIKIIIKKHMAKN